MLVSGASPPAARRAETQYLVATPGGTARLVWAETNGAPGNGAFAAFNREARLTMNVTDLLQSTSAVIDLFDGDVLERGTYLPSGVRETRTLDEAQEAFPLEPLGFTGKEDDLEVGLMYFGHRYLMPHLGRWASPDPLQIHSGGGGEFGNSYHYVAGNLLQARDPDGLDPTAVPRALAGGGVGGVVGAVIELVLGDDVSVESVGAAFVGGFVGGAVGAALLNPQAGLSAGTFVRAATVGAASGGAGQVAAGVVKRTAENQPTTTRDVGRDLAEGAAAGAVLGVLAPAVGGGAREVARRSPRARRVVQWSRAQVDRASERAREIINRMLRSSPRIREELLAETVAEAPDSFGGFIANANAARLTQDEVVEGVLRVTRNRHMATGPIFHGDDGAQYIPGRLGGDSAPVVRVAADGTATLGNAHVRFVNGQTQLRDFTPRTPSHD